MVQGHRFFAPEPGPGTMVAYKVERADGTVIEESIFPRREIKPRLMYHRYFMLSERVQDVGIETEWFRMYARHLAHELGGEKVALWRIVHELATPEDIEAGKLLSDEEFYSEDELGSWTLAELNEPWDPDADFNAEPIVVDVAPDDPAAIESDSAAPRDAEPSITESRP